MFFTEELKKELIDKGFLREATHSNGKLFLYNYTQIAQFDKQAFIDYPILKECRGLVLDKEGNVVARGFNKFWNFEEYGVGSTLGELPPYQDFLLFDKLDGSLGLVFLYEGELVVATRGSFESDQAKWAKKYVEENFLPELIDYYSISGVEGATFLFEIIYPENRIVVDYKGDKKLVLLGVVNREGKDWNHIAVRHAAFTFGIEVVECFGSIKEFKDFKNCREELPRDNAEGFVILFDNGLRVKMKYEEYCLLHKVMTGLTKRDIWESLQNKTNIFELLESKNIPDEGLQKVKNIIKDFELEYFRIDLYCDRAYSEIPQGVDRKTQALFIMNNHKIISDILFKMLDGKDFSKDIWKRLEPKHELVFSMMGEIG